MARCPPTPQLLRYLSRACRSTSTGRSPAYCSLRTISSPGNRHSVARRAGPAYLTRSYSMGTPTAAASETGADPPPNASTRNSVPDISDYYTLFPSTLAKGPPPSGPFDIPTRTLRSEFLRLQAQHHPDKFPSGTPKHKTSFALSSLLNNAYRTLSDPLLRAQYLLQLTYDIDVMSEDNSSHPTDQGTLMDVMESQEAIEDAQDQVEIDRLKDENAVRIERTVEKLSKAFEADDAETAKNETVRLKYWKSLQEGLESWEPGKEVRLIH